MRDDRPRRWWGGRLSGMTRGLARRMLLWILAISAVMAVMATSVQLSVDYQRDMSDLEQAMHYIEENQLPALAEAAWNFHADALKVQIEGIGRSPWVAGAMVRYGPNLSAEVSTGDIQIQRPEVLEFPLRRSVGNNVVLVGQIYIAPNLRDLYRRTIDRIAVVLATQAVKSLVISTAILLLVSGLVTRHLTQMAEFAKTFEPGKSFTPFLLRRGRKPPQDELTVLADCLNDAYRRLYAAHEFELRHSEMLSEQVALRTAELREAHEELARIARTDRLTGLLNRLGLDEAFAREIARAERYGKPMAAIIIDVDHFKAVNDTHGHQAGDAVLKEFAVLLAGVARRADITGRWGGEEFLILCPETDIEAACRVAERMRESVAVHDFPQVGPVTGSFGVTAFRPGETEDALVKRADQALYRAKQDGRNRVAWDDGGSMVRR
jgi:diguanylate cyclase (GGDEF)-like protein